MTAPSGACPASRASEPAAFPLPLLARWAALACALFLEATLLTQRYDVGTLRAVESGWARALEALQVGLPCAIAVAAAFVLLGRERVRRAVELHGTAPAAAPLPLVGAHLLAFAALAATTHWLFAAPPAGSATLALGVGAWLATALLTLGTLLLLALPLAAWRTIAGGGSAGFLASLGVGALAFLAGQQGEASLWEPLSAPTLVAVHALLGLVSPVAVLPYEGGVELGTATFAVHIGPSCSGYLGIGLTWIFVSVVLWTRRRELRFPHALLLLPAGALCAWCANVLRLVALILIGSLGAPSLALGAFHTRIGWVFFCGVALGLVWVAERARPLQRHPAPARATGASGAASVLATPAFPFVAPLLVLLAVQLVGGSFVERTELLAVPALLLGGAMLVHARPALGPLPRGGWWTGAAAGLAVFVAWVALEPGGAAGPDAALAGASLGVVVARGLVTSVVVPLAEELAFRGFLARRLMDAAFERVPYGALDAFAIVLSSLLFGLAHERWFAGILAGLAYALVLRRTRHLGPAVLAHAVTNGLLFARALA